MAIKVLVVDDDQDTAQSFAYLLVHLGHEATFLTKPGLVLETVDRVKPHIVFMDIHMPELTGWDVAAMIRKKYPQNGGLHLVAVSGSATDAKAHMKSRKAGFDAHVTKPVEIELIESIIKQLALRC